MQPHHNDALLTFLLLCVKLLAYARLLYREFFSGWSVALLLFESPFCSQFLSALLTLAITLHFDLLSGHLCSSLTLRLVELCGCFDVLIASFLEF